MRYALRNQHKIKGAFDQAYLDLIIKSLDNEFKDYNPEGEITVDNEPYPMIMVSKIDHTVNVFIFYIVEKKYDVYKLAFKEEIG